jgi:hypothetical protein
MRSRNSLIAIVAGTSLLTGCADYLNNRDTITLGAGNAPQANLGIHAINPFPASANNTHIHVDSQKVQQAYGRYVEPGDTDVVTGKPTTGAALLIPEEQ